MKPITEEIVLTLIERAERRQNATKPANDPQPRLPDSKDADADGEEAEDEDCRVIRLDFARRTARVRQTVSGVFCYARA